MNAQVLIDSIVRQITVLICLECGPAGGCSVFETVCAQTCSAEQPCTGGPGLTCFEGICQAYGCE